MKKRKALLLFITLILTIGITWIIEPLTFNPFSQVEIPEAKSEIKFNCDEPNLAINSELQSKANEIINKNMASNNFLGVTAGLYMENCGTTYLCGAGFTNKRAKKRANSVMLGRIASITKPMTAIAIMQLYEKGMLDLDKPIQTYLKEFPKKAKGDITIRHLLKHTSGISHYSTKWDAMSFTHYSSLVAALDAFKEKELEFEPGTQYRYSSYGYTVLGAIIEKVSQMNYGEYMKKNIWDKAEMSNTSLEEQQIYDNKSGLYLKVKSTYMKSPKTDLSIIYSAGGVQSTAKDLLKFGEAVLSNKLIDSTSLNIMINATDELAPAKGDDPYGFGWSVYNHPKYGKIIQHGGTQPGTSSFFAIYLDHKIVSVVLSNSFGTRQKAFNLSRDLANLALIE